MSVGALVSAIVAIAKAVPEARLFIQQLTDAWAAHIRNENLKSQAAKDERNDGVVDRAVAAGGLRGAGGQTAP